MLFSWQELLICEENRQLTQKSLSKDASVNYDPVCSDHLKSLPCCPPLPYLDAIDHRRLKNKDDFHILDIFGAALTG